MISCVANFLFANPIILLSVVYGLISVYISFVIVRELTSVLEIFKFTLSKKEKKTCRKLVGTFLSALYILFVFFHLYAVLFGR